MSTQNVIIKFRSYEDRELWISRLAERVRRIYRREPWLSASVSDNDVTCLTRDTGAKVYPDGKLSAM